MSLSTPPCPFNFSVCLHDINFQGQKEAKCELISVQGSGREQLYDNKVALNSENLQTPSMFLLPPLAPCTEAKMKPGWAGLPWSLVREAAAVRCH